MATVSIETAEKTLFQLLARGKEAVAKLVRIRPNPSKREFGSLKGVLSVDERFFEPLSDDEIRHWAQ